MDNGDQIQQTNLVSDDAVAAMGTPVATTTTPPVPTIAQPQTDSMPVGLAANPVMPDSSSMNASTSPAEPITTTDAYQLDTPVVGPAVTVPTSLSGAPIVSDSLAELDEIKRSALDELQPLIEHVEQSPEERYETIMMMIRSNDDPSLIASAYEATKGIKDEKTRASALLNIVSEIEYLKSKA